MVWITRACRVSADFERFQSAVRVSSSVCFQQWMQRAQSGARAGDAGYPIGQRVFAMLMDDSAVDASYADGVNHIAWQPLCRKTSCLWR